MPKKSSESIESSDIISPKELESRLKTNFIGREIRYYQELPSTNDKAKQLAEEGASEGLVVISEEQTKGRGRHGREWLSPHGGLWLSILIRYKAASKVCRNQNCHHCRRRSRMVGSFCCR